MMGHNLQARRRSSSISICVALVLFVLMGLGYLISLGSPRSEAAATPPAAISPSPPAPTITGAKAALKPYPAVPLEMDYSTHPKEAMIRMRRAVRESGGNFDRLSDHDKHMFDSVTGGFGRAWFQELFRNPKKYEGL